MRFCKSTILASLTSRGACTAGAVGMERAGAGGFFPPVSHMMRIMRTARPASSQDCTFFGNRPGGLGALSWMADGEVMVPPSLRRNLAVEVQFPLANGEIAGVEDFGNDVDAVFQLEVEQIRFPVLDLVQRWFLSRAAADIREGFIVVDGRDSERFSRRFRVEGVVEPELGCVAGPELVDLLGGMGLGRTNLLSGLVVNGVEFLLIGFSICGTNIAAKHAAGSGALFEFDEQLQVRLGIWIAADFGQEKRIDVPARRDEIEVAADASLRRVDIAQIVRAVDDPEFAVAGCGIQYLFFVGQT